jgi:hypothetical protein
MRERRYGLDRAKGLSVLSFVACFGLLCTVVGGCGGGDSYSVAPVSGQVTLDGQPLSGVMVSFQPVATGKDAPGPGSSGTTGADGRYTLQLAAAKSKPGAVVGKHTVRLMMASSSPAPDSDAPVKPAKEQIPQKYRDTPPTFEVPAGGTDKANFELTSK